MKILVELLQQNPLILLFLVAGIGYPLGRIRIGGISLGISAVLFAGLAFGAIDSSLKLPEIIYTLGLVLFVYTIGLSSGAFFFSSLRSKGLKYNILVGIGLICAAFLAFGAAKWFNVKGTYTAGLFSGSLTNTPALAAVLERIKVMIPAGILEQAQSEPVIAYSITYPVGVLGMILAMYFLQQRWKINYVKEAQESQDFVAATDPLQSQTIRILKIQNLTVEELVVKNHWNVIFGRLLRDGKLTLVTGTTLFSKADVVSLVGSIKSIEQVTKYLGEISEERLEYDLSKFDKQRMFISNPQVAGRRLGDLNLFSRFNGIITRLRRGDIEFLPHGDTILSLGDQVRLVAPSEQMGNISTYLGDSYRAVSEIDILTFGLGLCLGLIVGMIPIQFPGGFTFQLGIAGGPLLVSLVLGSIGRVGNTLVQIPYSANQTIRQIGLILFLAGVGTRSGYTFITTLTQGNGLLLFVIGVIITCVTALLTLYIGHRLLQIPFGLLLGILAGMQTQPAILAYALEQTGNEFPNYGYTAVYPLAMILKIVLAQVLLVVV